ncbi:MAG: hypothetical protein KJ066_18445 [Acidobacteria bacterium]|nr:hypothetical protein [Acidobacteriota bacterium]
MAVVGAAGLLLHAQGSVTVSPTTWEVGEEGGIQVISVGAPDGVEWTATSDAAWLTMPVGGAIVSEFAGSTQGFADGSLFSAKFSFPSGIALDGHGSTYVADAGNHRIRLITPVGEVTTLAGSSIPGDADGAGDAARFSHPSDVAIGPEGDVYVADRYSHRIRRVTPEGLVTTLAGSTPGHADGVGPAAQFFHPSGVVVDGTGVVYVADTYNHRVRKITPAGVVTTLAGSSPGIADGTGGDAQFADPTKVALDVNGDLLVTDAYFGRLRRVTPGGVVTTVAGSFPGDADGPAASALFRAPTGLAFDATGRLHVADTLNHKVKQLADGGVVSTVAGSIQGDEGGLGSTARFDHPVGLAFDAHGALYVTANHRIRKVSALQGWQTTGVGSSTLVLTATRQISVSPRTAVVSVGGQTVTVTQGGGTPQFSLAPSAWSPSGVRGATTATLTSSLVDAPWSASSSDEWLTVDPMAGVGSATLTLTAAPNPSTDPRSATLSVAGEMVSVTQRGLAEFEVAPTTWQVGYGGGTQLVLVTASDPDGVWTAESHVPWLSVPRERVSVTTLAGSPQTGLADGTGPAALFRHPQGLAVDAAGTLYVADTSNLRLRRVTPDGVVTTLVGSVPEGEDGPPPDLLVDVPVDLVLDGAGNLIVVEANLLSKVAPDGTISTLAGSFYGYADGAGTEARFAAPGGIAIDGAGNLYVADRGNHRIRKVTPAGVVTTLAGSGQGSADGPATQAQFHRPTGVAVDASGVVYVTDYDAGRIRRIAPDGYVTTLAGSTSGYADGVGAAAQFHGPAGLAIDAAGSLYVADRLNSRIRKVTPAGEVTTVSGSEHGYADGFGLNARFSGPVGIAVDSAGRIYVTDQGALIREVWRYEASVAGGTGSDGIRVTAAPQVSVHPRQGTVTIGGQSFTVTQAGGPITFTLDQTAWAPVASASTTSVALAASYADAPWTASSDHDWLTVTPAQGLGSATLTLAATANASSEVRSATVTIAGHAIVVSQSPPGSAFVPTGPSHTVSVDTAHGTVDLTFTDVSSAGTISITALPIDPTTLAAPPEFYRFLPDVTYDVTGTVQFTRLTICVPYDATLVAATKVRESSLALLWLMIDETEWRGGSLAVDVTNHRVCSHIEELRPLGVAGLRADAKRVTWYLAEGATGDFDMDIAIGNPHATLVPVRITWVLPPGAPAVAPTMLELWPFGRQTIRVNHIPGLERTAVSAIVESLNTRPQRDIVVERTMYWRHQGQTKGHNSPGVAEPATTWYLAEGATGDFNDFVLIANPSATDTALVDVTFLRDDGTMVGPLRREVGPGARDTVWVNLDVPELASASFSTHVASANDVAVIVERSMYFPSSSTQFPGPVGHQSGGVTSLSQRWIFGEGVTGGALPNPVFDTFLLLANPGSTAATVRVTYAKDTGERFEQTAAVDPGLVMPPNSRKTIWVNHDIPGFVRAAFSMEVLSDEPILAERAVYWGDGSPATWREAHNSAGATGDATVWAFAEGLDGVLDDSGTPFQSYFLVANTHPTEPLELKVTFHRGDGWAITRTYAGAEAVPPGARFTLASWQFPELRDKRFATYLESLNGTPFVAERAVYWGAGFVGGHASLGTPWDATIAFGTPPPQ